MSALAAATRAPHWQVRARRPVGRAVTGDERQAVGGDGPGPAARLGSGSAENRGPGAGLVELADVARDYVKASKAPSTLAAYRADWQAFTAWCAVRDVDPLPAAPETVALYAADLAGRYAVGSIARYLTSIGQAHVRAGYPSPTVQQPVPDVWAGIRRTFGTAGHPKAALVTEDVRALVRPLGAGLIDVRDRALLLIGFAGALRRSELVALDVEDVDDTADGLVVTIRRSKTDQDGAGTPLGIPWGSDPGTCPVRAWRAWLAASGIRSGAVFRQVDRHGRLLAGRMSGRAAAERVKVRAAAAGYDPALYSGHSLRRGFITAAARAGAHERDIMRHSRHKSVEVFRGYVEAATVFDSCAATVVGL